MAAPLSLDEALRLEALEAQKITDIGQDENFNRIARLAGAATETPVGLISFVEEDRQWFKAREGIALKQTPCEQFFCAHTLGSDEVMVVEDASRDPRFAANPLVRCEGGATG